MCEDDRYFNYLNNCMMNRCFDEKTFIKSIDSLINKGYDIYSSDNSRKIIDIYRQKKMYNVYKFMLICYLKQKIEKSIIERLFMMKKINGKFGNMDTKNISNNNNMIQRVIEYLCAFKFNKKTKELTESEYDDINEIMNRAKILVKKLDSKFINNLGIDIVYTNPVDLARHWDLFMKKTIDFYRKLKNDIAIHYEISNLYKKFVLTGNILINVSRYEKY